jgi:5'-nucleotidase
MTSTQLLQLRSTPTVYLDMDGVLSDFFGAWARRLGVDNDWGVIKTVPKSQRDADLERLARTDNGIEQFFANLDLLPGGAKILEWLNQRHQPFVILSSPLTNCRSASIAGKKYWLQKHGLGHVTQIFTAHKDQYATQPDGTANILIDDYGVNTRAWTAAGGVAIKHENTDTERTLARLEKAIRSLTAQMHK